MADPSIYPLRSLTTQYQESDLAFIERLLLEEGWFYWFELINEILTIDANGGFGIYVKVMHEGPWCSVAVDNAAMFDASTRETHEHD